MFTNTVLLALALLWLGLLLAAIAAMFISLGRQGDERRRAIVERSAAGTFAVTAVYLLFCVGEGIYRSVAHGLPMEGKNPFVSLTVMAITYLCHLFWYKRKYGG